MCLATTLLGVPDRGWFMINVKQMFFYRVDYDNDTRTDIVNQLLTDHTVSRELEVRSQHMNWTGLNGMLFKDVYWHYVLFIAILCRPIYIPI